MQDLNDLYYFAQVVKYAGFSPTERQTGIPKSKLSRRIAALEQRLGVSLIQRSTRHFSLTEIGELYYRHCQAMLIEAEAADEAIAFLQAKPRGTVRISCPVDLLQNVLGDLLVQFMLEYPDITLDLEATNRVVDPIAEGIDLVLRVRPPPLEDSDLILRILAQFELYLCASPHLFKNTHVPQTPQELNAFPSLSLKSIQQKYTWKLIDATGNTVHIAHKPRILTDNMSTLRSAAIAGMGIVELPSLLVEEQLRTGQLIKLLPKCSAKPDLAHIVYASRRGQLPAVRALINFLVAHFKNFNKKSQHKAV